MLIFWHILNFPNEISTLIVFSVLKNIGFHGFWYEIRQHKIVQFLSLWSRAPKLYTVVGLRWQGVCNWVHVTLIRYTHSGPMRSRVGSRDQVYPVKAPTWPYMGDARSRDWAVVTWTRARSIYGLVCKQSELSRAASPYMGMSRAALTCEPTANY